MAAILILNKLEFGALMSKNLKIIKSTKLLMDAFKKTDSLPLKFSPSPQSSHMSQRETGCMLLHRKLVWDQNCTGDWHRFFSPHSHGTKDTALWRPLSSCTTMFTGWVINKPCYSMLNRLATRMSVKQIV